MARIKRGLAEVAAGTETLAGVSRGLGKDSSYLQVRARKDPELRRLMDQALEDRAEQRMDYASGTGAILEESIIGIIHASRQPDGEPLTPADIDRLARALLNLVDIQDRASAAARQREAARPEQGDTAGEIFKRLEAMFAPASAPDANSRHAANSQN